MYDDGGAVSGGGAASGDDDDVEVCGCTDKSPCKKSSTYWHRLVIIIMPI